MSLPIFLPYGVVSIYGIGSLVGQTSIVPPPDYLFGTIDAVSQYNIYWAQPGYSVLFPNFEVICKLAYAPDNTSYTLIEEAKLVCREIPLP